MVELGDVVETERESFRIIEFLEEPNTGLANVECIRGGEVFQVRTVPVSLLEAVGTAVGNVPFPFCEECDHQIERVDEDGCCLTCGNDAIHPTAAHVREAIHGRRTSGALVELEKASERVLALAWEAMTRHRAIEPDDADGQYERERDIGTENGLRRARLILMKPIRALPQPSPQDEASDG